MRKQIFLLFLLLVAYAHPAWSQTTDPFAGFDVPIIQGKSPATKEQDPFADIELSGGKKKSSGSEEPFAGFELPGERPKKEITPFSGFELPGEQPQKQPAVAPTVGKIKESEKIFAGYELPSEKPQRAGVTLPASRAGDWWEQVEQSGESVLFYANIYNLYYQGKKWLSPASALSVSRQALPRPHAGQETDIGQEKAWLAQLEKQILQNKERAMPSSGELERVTVETIHSYPEIADVKSELPPLAATEMPEITATVLPEKDNPGIPWIKFAMTQEFTVFELRHSLFNPDNKLDFIHYLHRSLLLTTVSCPLYDNQSPQSPFLISLYVKDTYVYADQVYPLSPEFSKNYLQEAYLSMQYERLGLTVGKIVLRPGDGGGLAWNPTDYFDFYSQLYHPRDGNFQKRGVRSGLWAVQASYSLPFGTLMFAYAPDMSDDGNVHENSEYNNNRENIVFAKFNWILFEERALIGPLGHTLTPASPDFFFSYFDRGKQINVGFVWSLGIGNNLLLRFESNYSRKTEMEELAELLPFGPYRQFAWERRAGRDWLTVFSLLYTWQEFNLDAEYLFHYNGWNRAEWDVFSERVRYLRENYRDPLFGPQYAGLLGQSATYDALSWGRHYVFLRLSRTFLVEPKKRSLQTSVSWIVNLEDGGSSLGCGLTYQFFTYAKVELAYSTVLASHATMMGESPIDSMFAMALELLF
jgi:hypothetical protein